MRKFKALTILLTTMIAITACSDDKTSTVVEESHTTITETTTTSTPASTTDIETLITEPTSEASEEYDSIFDYYKTLGTVIHEGNGDENSELYTLIVQGTDGSMDIYFKLPETTIERNVYTIVMSIEPYLELCNDSDSVSLDWHDSEEEWIASYSAIKTSSGWSSPLGIMWLNKEYENTLNALVSQGE